MRADAVEEIPVDLPEARSLDTSAWRRDLVTALIGFWIVTGVFIDGWAHINAPERESFFTPWHAPLYSGLAAFAGWLAVLAWRRRRTTGSWLAALPAGYRPGALGVVVFAFGGVADLAWHEIFGLEVAIDALVSPSHLILLAGGLLMVSTAWRAQRIASPGRATFPELLSLATAVAFPAFFISYTSAFAQAAPTTIFDVPPEGAPGHFEAEAPTVMALSAYLVTTALIVVPLLASLVLGRRPSGLVTVLVGMVGGFCVAEVNLPPAAVGGTIGAVLGAAVADLLLSWLRPEEHRGRFALPVAAALVTMSVWSGHLLGFAVYDSLRWPVVLWSGMVLITSMTAASLAFPSMLATAHHTDRTPA